MESKNNEVKVGQTTNIPFNAEIVSINDKFFIYFLSIPNDYEISNFKVEHHKTHIIGRLNQFNRIKVLKNWKKEYGCLVKLFKEVLEKRGWDFREYPNPVALAAYLDKV
jgi:hypothetical protein